MTFYISNYLYNPMIVVELTWSKLTWNQHELPRVFTAGPSAVFSLWWGEVSCLNFFCSHNIQSIFRALIMVFARRRSASENWCTSSSLWRILQPEFFIFIEPTHITMQLEVVWISNIANFEGLVILARVSPIRGVGAPIAPHWIHPCQWPKSW